MPPLPNGRWQSQPGEEGLGRFSAARASRLVLNSPHHQGTQEGAVLRRALAVSTTATGHSHVGGCLRVAEPVLWLACHVLRWAERANAGILETLLGQDPYTCEGK